MKQPRTIKLSNAVVLCIASAAAPTAFVVHDVLTDPPVAQTAHVIPRVDNDQYFANQPNAPASLGAYIFLTTAVLGCGTAVALVLDQK